MKLTKPDWALWAMLGSFSLMELLYVLTPYDWTHNL